MLIQRPARDPPAAQGTCCGGQKLEVCVQRMTDALHDEFFQPMAVALPAQNRWYTFGPSLTTALGLHCIHKILPRVVKRCFSHEDAPPAGDGDDDSFRVYCHKRKKQAAEFVASSDCDLTLATAFISTAPVDHAPLARATAAPLQPLWGWTRKEGGWGEGRARRRRMMTYSGFAERPARARPII